MTQHGIKGMISQNGSKLAHQIFRTYQEEAAKAGRNLELGEDLCLGVGMSIAPTVEEAIEAARPYQDESYKWFAPFGFVRYTDEEGRPWGTPGAPSRVPTIEEGIQQRVWFCGPPEIVIEGLKKYEAEFPGLEHVILRWPEGMPLEQFKEQLTRFAEEVMPHFG